MQIKSFDKIQHSFIRKSLSKLRIERNFLNLMKNIYTKPIPVITNDKIVNDFSPKISKKT